MDRKLARRNIVSGLVAAGVAVLMFGLTFVAVQLYLG
jgi:cytochrome c oxidase assembly protein Cox11